MRIALLLALLNGFWGPALAQTAADFPRDDNYLLIEYDRYSLKMLNRDPAPLLRIYGSGRAEVYYSAWSPRAGIYELRVTPAELASLITTIVSNGLDTIDSVALDELLVSQEMARQELTGTLFYTSDATISELQVYLPGARAEPLQVENLQSTSSRMTLPASISALAGVERDLLQIAGRSDAVLVGQPRAVSELR